MTEGQRTAGLGIGRMVAGVVAAGIPLATRCVFPEQVAAMMGGHNIRAGFEHMAESALLPLITVGLAGILWGIIDQSEKKLSVGLGVGTLIAIWWMFQVTNELAQSRDFSRPLQIDQLAFSLIGFGVGIGLVWVSRTLARSVSSDV